MLRAPPFGRAIGRNPEKGGVMMDFIFLTMLCALASIGLVQLMGWVSCWFLRPEKHRMGYYLIPLDVENPGDIEPQLRYQLTRARWFAGADDGVLLVVTGDFQWETQEICRKLLRGGDPVILCKPEELPELLS
jgi:hypothetical protein